MILRGRVDPRLAPVLGEHCPLLYRAGGDPSQDRPAHVRAASALRWAGSRLVIVQDDVLVLALHQAGGATEHLLLEAGASGSRVFDSTRGNKHLKLDLEACASLPDGRLVAFGSGSTPARERLVVLDSRHAVRIVQAGSLYARLRAEQGFSGSELNLEGALVVGERLRLFQRGNGAPRDGLLPVNATCDVPLASFLRSLEDPSTPLPLLDVTQYDLGSVAGVSFGFTDAALMPDGRVAFLACAEASPDAVQDGAVLGCRFGLIEGYEVRLSEVREASGEPTRLKLEGLEALPGPAGHFHVVADMDAPDEPAVLAQLEVSGL